jgi:hypothetical protein
LTTRETVLMLTPARAATSRIVGLDLSMDSDVNVGLLQARFQGGRPVPILFLQSKSICAISDNVVF